MSQGAPSGLTGYAVVVADDLAAATDRAMRYPHLDNGGRVDVCETYRIM